jgi:hypothetical protein
VACWVKRIGGGRVERFGAVSIVVEDLIVHILRETATPAAGDTISIGGQTFTVEAKEPVENDAQGLLWACRVTWGLPVTWSRPGGEGGPVHPIALPEVDYTAAAASSGAASITILASAWPDGWIRAGDLIAIDGETYTATDDVEPGYSGGYRFGAVPITPALVGALAGGEVVTIEAPSGAPGDQIVRAAVADYRAEEIMGGVLTGDRRNEVTDVNPKRSREGLVHINGPGLLPALDFGDIALANAGFRGESGLR